MCSSDLIKGDYRDFLREHSPEIDNEVGLHLVFIVYGVDYQGI